MPPAYDGSTQEPFGLETTRVLHLPCNVTRGIVCYFTYTDVVYYRTTGSNLRI